MKCAAARRQIAKKDAKVAEIDRTIAEDIAPRQQALRKQRGGYQKWAATEAQVGCPPPPTTTTAPA